MTSDPITSVSGSFSGDSIKRFSASIREDIVDLSKIDPPAAGAYLGSNSQVQPASASSSMHLKNLRTVVTDGLENGFVRKQLDIVAAKLADYERPGSLITQGELKRDMVMIGERFAVAEAFSKAATKMSESLMTIVKS
jgi:hypothetical protein